MERYFDIRIPDTGHEFELLSKSVCQVLFNVPFALYGRNGQDQSGIDLFSKKFEICVQCKNYQGNDAAKRLLAGLERDFVAAYEKFQPAMKQYVLATTVLRDNKIQDHVESIVQKYNIEIRVVFWEEFQEILKAHPEIVSQYNKTVALPQLSGSDDHKAISSGEEKRLCHADKLLQNGSFSEAMDQYDLVLASNVECGEAYLGKLMAELHVRGKEQFRAYFRKKLVYNHINFKFAKEYADASLKTYLESLSYPVCKNHNTVATGVCTHCNSLICKDCSFEILSVGQEAPWPFGQTLCPTCAERIHTYSTAIAKKNRKKILLFFIWIALGLVFPILSCITEESAKAFFLSLGIEGVIVAFIRKIFSQSQEQETERVDVFAAIIVLPLKVCFWMVIAPLWILWKCGQRVCWIVTMEKLLKADRRAAAKGDRPFSQYVETYAQLVYITGQLNVWSQDEMAAGV